MRRNWVLIVPLGILALALFVFVGGEVVKELWNWLLPPLFGWRELSFWQALGMLALCRILFGGVGLHGSDGFRARRRMSERWERMSPEERERFRKGIRGWCGVVPSGDEGTGQ